MILRSKTIDLAKLRALAGAYNLAINGSEHGLASGRFKDGYRIDFKLELVAPTPSEPERTAQFQRRSTTMRTNSGYMRKVRAVCWHGHREVMKSIFAYDPEARLVTSFADYDGSFRFHRDFEATGNRNVGSRMLPMQFRDACDCHEDSSPETTVTIMRQSDILACPHVIIMPQHYRDNGTCKCNDPNDPNMSEWGYTWNPEKGQWDG